jgi:DNA polymerase III epsilon subunit-like protein
MLDTNVLGPLWLHERDGEGPPRLTLSALATALDLPVHRPHNALGDALTTAQAFLALVSHLDARSPETVRSLARAEARLEVARLYPSQRC